MSKRINIKKGDQVIVISGEEKNKKGKVISVDPASSRVIVEGINMVTKHKKPRSQADLGGIIHQEAPIASCKVMHVCDKCKQATRCLQMAARFAFARSAAKHLKTKRGGLSNVNT